MGRASAATIQQYDLRRELRLKKLNIGLNHHNELQNNKREF